MKILGAHRLGDLIAGSAPCLGGAIAAWHAEVSAAKWATEADILRRHPNALTADGRVLFDLGHDDHCAIVRVNYEMQSVLMTYIGTRAKSPWAKQRARKAKPTS